MGHNKPKHPKENRTKDGEKYRAINNKIKN
jgi:hypothetical protein